MTENKIYQNYEISQIVSNCLRVCSNKLIVKYEKKRKQTNILSNRFNFATICFSWVLHPLPGEFTNICGPDIALWTLSAIFGY